MKTITAPELAARLVGVPATAAAGAGAPAGRPVLLDVREPWEFDTCHIEGAVPMPMNTIPVRLSELDEDASIVCICHHGARSMQVAAFLERNGFSDVTNLTGGIHAWALQVDKTMPTY
jgi:rhodanese-related sulfurtransferase